MALPQYPSTLPDPLIEGYQIDVDMGVVRTAFGSGVARQRRLYRNMPEIYTWAFTVPVKDLYVWQEWVKKNAYTWFKMNIFSSESSRQGSTKVCTPHVVRFISELSITPLNRDQHVQISVTGELAPRGLYSPPAVLSDNWIVAKTPLDAATPDWIYPRRLFEVATDEIVAGSTLFPAATV
jgi:hypothetical protein